MKSKIQISVLLIGVLVAITCIFSIINEKKNNDVTLSQVIELNKAYSLGNLPYQNFNRQK